MNSTAIILTDPQNILFVGDTRTFEDPMAAKRFATKREARDFLKSQTSYGCKFTPVAAAFTDNTVTLEG